MEYGIIIFDPQDDERKKITDLYSKKNNRF